MNSINKEKQLIVRSSDGNVSEAERSEKQNVQSMKEDIIMAKIKESAVELIGGTPILKAGKYSAAAGVTDATILTKLEYLNLTGSVKDRISLAMIEDAEKKGILKPGATIIEPTSGNTGIGLAAVATAKGYHAVLTLPDTMSIERRTLLKAYGYKRRTQELLKYLRECMMFYHMQTYLRGKEECDIGEIGLDEMITIRVL